MMLRSRTSRLDFLLVSSDRSHYNKRAPAKASSVRRRLPLCSRVKEEFVHCGGSASRDSVALAAISPRYQTLTRAPDPVSDASARSRLVELLLLWCEKAEATGVSGKIEDEIKREKRMTR